jgi:ketosteroid isomerase-like protein
MSPAHRNGGVSEIRSLIEGWARAVHAGDLETVLADHADDIVMFDVPPPDDGVRGIDAYRETCRRPRRGARRPA